MALTTALSTGISERDVIPAHLPFFHVFGVLGTLTTGIAMGITSVVLPRFDFEQYLQLIQDYRVTRSFATPPILVQLAKNPIVENFDLSSLRVITCGAAPLSAETEALVRGRIGCQINQGYGMTEMRSLSHSAGRQGKCVSKDRSACALRTTRQWLSIQKRDCRSWTRANQARFGCAARTR